MVEMRRVEQQVAKFAARRARELAEGDEGAMPRSAALAGRRLGYPGFSSAGTRKTSAKR